jgi:hypothetical protein
MSKRLNSSKTSGTFYAKSRENYMELEDNNEKFDGKSTRNLKEKHREFFTREGSTRYQIQPKFFLII